MALFTESQIRKRYQEEYGHRIRESRNFSASTILAENMQTSEMTKVYDIFLSHNSTDNEILAGLTLILQDLGYTVYVDWNDPVLDKDIVTPKTAAILRERMKQSRSFIYVFSENSLDSKWMPWELGYFDGLKDSRIAILPISQSNKNLFKGSEYIGLYNYVQIAKIRGYNKDTLWVHSGEDYVIYSSWLTGKLPFKHSK